MSRPRVYAETSVISYPAARPSRDLLVAARQEATREWWEFRGTAFDPWISRLVMREAAAGDPNAASRRLEYCRPLPSLLVTPEAERLANNLIDAQAIPESEPEDALHIALATLAGFDFIATWNFAHLVGPVAKYGLQKHIDALGFPPPLLATPEELLESLP